MVIATTQYQRVLFFLLFQQLIFHLLADQNRFTLVQAVHAITTVSVATASTTGNVLKIQTPYIPWGKLQIIEINLCNHISVFRPFDQ